MGQYWTFDIERRFNLCVGFVTFAAPPNEIPTLCSNSRSIKYIAYRVSFLSVEDHRLEHRIK
jgi:hypothetical protein